MASWFQQGPPQLSMLLQPTASSPSPSPPNLTSAADPATLHAASNAWLKADTYYYRAIARLQKLWQAARQPHADVSSHEVHTACRLQEHLLHLCRRGRSTLAQVGQLHADLSALTAVMDGLGKGSEHAESAGDRMLAPSAAGAESVRVSGEEEPQPGVHLLVPPPQQAGMRWMLLQKARMDGVLGLIEEVGQLVDAVIPVVQAQGPGGGPQAQLLKEAASRLLCWGASVAAGKQALDGQVDAHAQVAWVSHGAWRVLRDNYRCLEALHAKVAALVGGGEGGQARGEAVCIPGMDQLLLQLQSGREEAQAWVEEDRVAAGLAAGTCLAPGTPATGARGASAGDMVLQAAPGLLSGPAGELPGPAAVAAATSFSHSLESLVSQVLLWAQPATQGGVGGGGSTATPTPAPAAEGQLPEAPGVESHAQAMVSAGLTSGLAHLDAGLKLARVRDIASEARRLIALLAESRDSLVAGGEMAVAGVEPMAEGGMAVAGGEPGVSAGLLACMALRLRRTAPLLHLVRGALQQHALLLMQLHKAACKLSYVSCSLLATLAEEGFCMPTQGEGKEGALGRGGGGALGRGGRGHWEGGWCVGKGGGGRGR